MMIAQGQTRNFDPLVETRKDTDIYELVRLVNALWQLEQRPMFGSSAEQAAAMLVILQTLSEAETLAPSEARLAYQSLESLLNAEQQGWWLELRKAQEAAIHKRSVQIRTLGQPSVYMLLPGYSLMLKKSLLSEAFNPFKMTPNDQTLARLISFYEAKR